MSEQNIARALLIKDGDDFYLRSLSGQRVHIAFIDVAQNNPDGQGTIRALIPGASSDEEANALLDLAKTDMESYVQSGNFERDREISQRDREISRLREKSPAAANAA